MALESTQPLTEMNTRNLPVSTGLPARKADNFTAVSRFSRENVGTLMCHNSMSLHGLLRG
jgi:hypothetical protein